MTKSLANMANLLQSLCVEHYNFTRNKPTRLGSIQITLKKKKWKGLDGGVLENLRKWEEWGGHGSYLDHESAVWETHCVYREPASLPIRLLQGSRML